MNYFELIGFGENGWGGSLLLATRVTILVSVSGFSLGVVIGIVAAFARLSTAVLPRLIASAYTTMVRGVPDLLLIYLLYFGGSSALSYAGSFLGQTGFVGMPAFATGTLAIGVISGAYLCEIFRSAIQALNRGELEAGRAIGMSDLLLFRRIVFPQLIRIALPATGNIWQLALKESALVSVIGLVEILRQASIAAGSTRYVFEFYLTAAALYLLLATISSLLFTVAERRLSHP